MWGITMASAVLLTGAAVAWRRTRPEAGMERDSWRRLAGKISVGEWLQTGASSTATLTVGAIGTVQSSRIRASVCFRPSPASRG